MKNVYKLLAMFILTASIFMMNNTSVYADSKIDEASLKTCIELFCEKMYGSMLADSTTSFTKDDFLSVEGYLTAKIFEAKRDYELIDVPGGFTHVKITDVIVKSTHQDNKENVDVTARIKCNYISGDAPSYWGNDYQFTVRAEGDSLSVVDVKALEGDEFLNVRDSLHLWQKECSYAGEDWEYEAIDRILNNKKFDIESLVSIDEIEPEPEVPSIRESSMASKTSTTISYDASKAATYAYTTSDEPYDEENYIFCVAYNENNNQMDCTNFVSQCVWAGYGGTTGYSLPSEPTYYNSTLTALRNRVQNDFRMIPGQWYGRYYRTPRVLPPAKWCGVTDFWDYAVGNTGNGSIATGFNNSKKWNQYSGTLKRGDILQFKSNNGSTYTHSVFFHSTGTNYIQDAANLYVCQHTSYNPHRRLSTIIRSYSSNDPENTPGYMRRMRFYNGTFSS
jgi:hypothetical protein